MFVKFGKKAHVIDLYENGTIYMNTIQYFRDLEDKELRGDVYEGVSKISNYPPGQFEIPSIDYKGNYLALHLRKSYKTVLGNIYSLYCISSRSVDIPEDFKIDTKNKRFGRYCLAIKDNKRFLSLIEEKLGELNVPFYHGFVNYYDKKEVNRDISLFEKPLEFEYQKEFRFYVDSGCKKPIPIKIGSLKNIAEIYSTSDFINSFKLILKNKEAVL